MVPHCLSTIPSLKRHFLALFKANLRKFELELVVPFWVTLALITFPDSFTQTSTTTVPVSWELSLGV